MECNSSELVVLQVAVTQVKHINKQILKALRFLQ